MRLFDNQIVRFLVVGGSAAALNWLIRFPLAAVMPQSWAIVLAYFIGMSAGFVLYSRYVFPGSSRSVMAQTLIFVAVNAVGAVVVLGLTHLLIEAQAGYGWPDFVKEGLAHGIAIGVGAVVNFTGHKTLTFRLAPGGLPQN
jgi:energy-coupling factor transport system substrate-specific component